MAATNYGDLKPKQVGFAVATALARALPQECLTKFGQQVKMPLKNTDTAKMSRWNPLPPALTPLVEGVSPTLKSPTRTDVYATVQQFGDAMALTDMVTDLEEDDVLSQFMGLAGEQATETRELVAWGVLRGGTNVIYANGTARGSVNTALSLTKLRATVGLLKRMRAKTVTKVLAASAGISTRPVEPAFIAVCHTDMDPDIRSLTGFVPVAQYGTRSQVSEFELGSVENVRFVTCAHLTPFADAGGAAGGTFMSTSGTQADVYPILVFGEDAFGHVSMRGKDAIVPMVVNPKPAPGDPLGQRGSVGWKTLYACQRLNEAWIVRMEVAATKQA